MRQKPARKAEGFRLDIAEAVEGTAEANRKAEVERLARVKIEEKLADRSLTKEQADRLTAILSAFKGQKVNIIEYTLSNEAVKLSRQIQSILTAAGWEVKTIGIVMGAEMNTPGVLVLIAKEQIDLPAARALAQLLNLEGIASSYSFDGGVYPQPTPMGTITLLVAQKP